MSTLAPGPIIPPSTSPAWEQLAQKSQPTPLGPSSQNTHVPKDTL